MRLSTIIYNLKDLQHKMEHDPEVQVLLNGKTLEFEDLELIFNGCGKVEGSISEGS